MLFETAKVFATQEFSHYFPTKDKKHIDKLTLDGSVRRNSYRDSFFIHREI